MAYCVVSKRYKRDCVYARFELAEVVFAAGPFPKMEDAVYYKSAGDDLFGDNRFSVAVGYVMHCVANNQNQHTALNKGQWILYYLGMIYLVTEIPQPEECRRNPLDRRYLSQ